MKIAVNIKVRNPEWYWTKEQLAESKKKDSMSRSEWEMLSEDKIPKHSVEVDFEFKFDVKSYIDKRDSEFYLTVYVSNKDENTFPAKHYVILKNVTVVGFIGEKEESYVIVSDELIHQFISANKNSKGKLYWYFYLKENADYVCLFDNIWLSNAEYRNLFDQFGKFSIEMDPNIRRKKISGSFTTKVLVNSRVEF